MKYKVFALRDAKAECFSTPHFHTSTPVAIRNFADAVNRADSGALSQHPEDFQMFQLAEYDDEKGTFVNLQQPVSLAAAMDLKKSGPDLAPTSR